MYYHLQLCSKHIWQDGKCDDRCNSEYCYYDGGDCKQLCDCDLDLWFNDKCDQSCNNTQCNYDFYTCRDATIGVNDTCYNNIDDNITNTCYTLWTDDEWCDLDCDNLACNYDNEYCVECAGLCNYGTSLAALIDLYEPHELITVDEICENEDLLSIFQSQDNFVTKQYNCTEIFDIVDANDNQYVGVWETIVAASYFIMDDAVHLKQKLQQIDCSMCMSDPSLYKM